MNFGFSLGVEEKDTKTKSSKFELLSAIIVDTVCKGCFWKENVGK